MKMGLVCGPVRIWLAPVSDRSPICNLWEVSSKGCAPCYFSGSLIISQRVMLTGSASNSSALPRKSFK